MLPLLTTLSPNAAILIMTAGAVLIAIELNRPGSILPGALGLLLTLLAAASLHAMHPSAVAALETAACIGLMIFGERIRLPWQVVCLATVPLIAAIAVLVPRNPGPAISAWAAVLSGLILGTGTIVLTGIARRARQNKGLD